MTCAGAVGVATAVVWTGPLFSTPPQELQGALLGLILLLCSVSVVGQFCAWKSLRRRSPDPAEPLMPASKFPPIDLAVWVFCGLGLVGSGDVVRGLFAGKNNLSIVQRHADVTTESGRSVRVLNMNVLHGYPDFNDHEARYGRTLAAFQDLKPDVLVLQEVWSTREYGDLAHRLADDLDMNVAYAKANGSLRFLGFEEGSAVLSRYPIESAERMVLEPRVPVWETRIAVVVRLNIGGPSPLTVVSMHLSDKNLEIAREQAQYLAARVQDADIIAGGELTYDGPSYVADNTGALRVFRQDGWRDTLPGGIDHVLVDAHPSNPWEIRRADWMLHPESFRIASEPTFAISDHPAILIDLKARKALAQAVRPVTPRVIKIAGAF